MTARTPIDILSQLDLCTLERMRNNIRAEVKAYQEYLIRVESAIALKTTGVKW